MSYVLLRNFLFTIFFILFSVSLWALPPGFVYLQEMDSTIIQEMKYASQDNFVGRPIIGYQSSTCILTKEAAIALAAVQKKLQSRKLSLKIYDCYRPQRAVNDFISWSQDLSDQKKKAHYYPHVNKADFFKQGYVAVRSGHSRGSTVDLTIINQAGDELDMGTPFDFMDESSHVLSKRVSSEARSNRLFLRQIMIDAGFSSISTEWWHFVLRNEPFNKAFNFLVK